MATIQIEVHLSEKECIEYLAKKGLIPDIVRCKDCQLFRPNDDLALYSSHSSSGLYIPRDGRCNHWYGLSTDFNGYCSYGKRKE